MATTELPCPTHKTLDCNCDAARAQRLRLNASVPAAASTPRTFGHIEGSRPNTVEAVNHPQHYGGDTTYETVKVIEAWDLNFNLGNSVKYISRAGKKDPAKTLEDLKKARWYLEREITKLERK